MSMETMDLGWITLYCLHSAIHCLVSAAYSNTLRHRCPALLHSRLVPLTVDPGYRHGSPPPAGTADQSPIACCPPALCHCPSALIFSRRVLHSPLFYHKFYMPYTYTFR